jgi:RecB family endonuclease NucS
LEREADLLEVVAGILRARGGALLHEPTIRAASHTLRPDIMVRDAEGNLIVVECKMRAAGALLSIAPLQQLERYLEWLSQPARGLLVTTGHLSEAALHYAESSNARIELWDGNRLLDELARVQQGDEAADAAT